ncbi:MAG: glycerol-3-phosphate 1-O-acyltransferase PlsY [bacterium]|nr:glycerol-3-phosphate 1-O-acyltransferase PlsY [bacterium]
MYKMIAIVTASYLIGSIPFGLLIGKAVRGIDIRQHGSGNIGATNVLRILGYPWGVTAMLLDAAKGAIPVILAHQLGGPLAAVLAGIASLLGHNRSIWLGFKGGKGVATTLGVLLGLSPAVAGACTVIWLIVLAVSRYVSLASVVTAVFLTPVMAYFNCQKPVLVFGLIASIWVLLRHRDNIKRLLAGTENRFGKRVRLPVEQHESDA